MTDQEVLAKTNQILDEERRSPTVDYLPNRQESHAMDLTYSAETLRLVARLQVQENPRAWAFKSINYDLLCALLSQVSAASRPVLINAIIHRIVILLPFAQATGSGHPNWDGLCSELPLVGRVLSANWPED